MSYFKKNIGDTTVTRTASTKLKKLKQNEEFNEPNIPWIQLPQRLSNTGTIELFGIQKENN